MSSKLRCRWGKTHFPKKGLTTGKNDVFLRLWF